MSAEPKQPGSPRDSISADEKARKKQSWSLRMKKHLASKGASLELGKKAIMHFLGDEGIVILNSLKAAASKDLGKDKANDLITSVFKMAFKIKIMYDEGTLTETNTKHFEDPLNTLGVAILEYLDDTAEVQKEIEQKLRQEEETKEAKEERDVKEKEAKEKLPDAYRPVNKTSTLVGNFSRIRDMTIDLVSEWMTDKNCAKLKDLFDYFGGEHFLLLILSPSCKEERSQLYSSFAIFLKPLVEHMKALSEGPSLTCMEPECEKPRVRATKEFVGTKYCAQHHEERFRQIYLDSTFEKFINLSGAGPSSGTGLLFGQWLKTDRPDLDADVNLLNLWFAIDAIKQIEQQKLKQTRSKILFDKYLNSYSKNVVKGLDRKMIDTLEAKLELINIPDSVFKPLQDSLYEILQKLFIIFCESETYHVTAHSLILPDKIRKELKLSTREELIKELNSAKGRKDACSSPSSSSSSSPSHSSSSSSSSSTTAS